MKVKWQDWLNLVLGAWVFISPWVMQPPAGAAGESLSALATWNLWIVGGAIVVFALAAQFAFRMWEEWVNVVLGLWLVASPWVFGFTFFTSLTWATILAGLLIASAAVSTLVPMVGKKKQNN